MRPMETGVLVRRRRGSHVYSFSPFDVNLVGGDGGGGDGWCCSWWYCCWSSIVVAALLLLVSMLV